jgi:tyrosyl-tRNA synthetase
VSEIARLEALQGAEINLAKKALADAATALLHGEAAAHQAAETARQTFEEGSIAGGLPTVEITTAEIAGGLGILTAFVRAGLVPSTGEARRQIKAGGLRLSDVIVSDDRAILNAANFDTDGLVKLSFGKKKHVLLKRV